MVPVQGAALCEELTEGKVKGPDCGDELDHGTGQREQGRDCILP